MIPLCRLDELGDPGAKGPFRIELEDGPAVVFVTRKGGMVRVWANVCPHVGAPLEMEPDKYLDLTGEYIICSMHGARFDLESGLCVWGPCKGRKLPGLTMAILNGIVMAGPPTKAL